MRALAIVKRVSPLREPEFEWPAMSEIKAEQKKARDRGEGADAVWDDEQECWRDLQSKIWVPKAAIELQERLCVVAHAGLSGHRGVDATVKALGDMFALPTLKADVREFVGECLHCMSVDGFKVPRPYGPTWFATRPNELLHFDWLSLPTDSETGDR